MNDFVLDARLARDTVPVGDLPLGRVLLMDDANFPWLLLVPRRANVVELIDLADEDRQQLMREIALVSHTLRSVTECEKLNVAAIGNVVAQLHVHVVARRHADAAWPKPVWGAVPPLAYDPRVREGFIRSLQRRMGIGPG